MSSKNSWVGDSLNSLVIGQCVLSLIVFIVGVVSLVTGSSLVTVVWVGLVLLTSSLFGILLVRDPEKDFLLVGYMSLTIMGCVACVVVLYSCAVGIIFSTIEMKENPQTSMEEVMKDDDTRKLYISELMSILLLGLLFAYIVCSIVSCVRIGIKLQDPCCDCAQLNFPGPVVYLTLPDKEQARILQNGGKAIALCGRRSRSLSPRGRARTISPT